MFKGQLGEVELAMEQRFRTSEIKKDEGTVLRLSPRLFYSIGQPFLCGANQHRNGNHNT